MKKFNFIFWLFLPILFTSCLSEGYDTIILPQSESSEVVETGIEVTILSLSIQKKLEVYMPVFKGSTPPDITGSYMFNPLSSVYFSDGSYAAGTIFNDYAVRFSNINRTTNTLSFDDWTQTNGYSPIANANIIGSGNNFTVYYSYSYTQDGKNYEYVILVSGTRTSTGIKDPYYGYLFFEGGNLSYYYVLTDHNNLAENATWGKSARMISQEESSQFRFIRLPKN